MRTRFHDFAKTGILLTAAVFCTLASYSCTGPVTATPPASGAPLVVYSFNQTDEEIRADILMHTPLGCSVDDVLDFIDTKLSSEGSHALRDIYNQRQGVLIQDERGRFIKRIGTQSIQVALRKGMILFGTKWIYCKWAFSEDNKLIEIILERPHDTI